MDPTLASLSPPKMRQIQTLVLRRITELVSPFPDSHVSPRSYEPLVSNIFPDPDSDTVTTSDPQRKRAFTQAGVLFQHLANDTAGQSQPRTDENIWFLSRQRFMRDRDPIKQIDVSPNGSFTPWILWDNRYWLRLRLVPSEPDRDVSELSRFLPLPLTIRPFHKLDMERIRRDTVNSRPRGAKKKGAGERLAGSIEHIQALFSAEAPSQLRFTLPVVAREGVNTRVGKPLDLKVREQLALPTLEYRLAGHAAEYSSPSEVELLHVGWRFKLKWQWMYKMIDTEALRLMGWPVGGNTDDA
jgi:tRNA(Ile)-lysidine synthase